MKKPAKTSERISPEHLKSLADYFFWLRHLKAYRFYKKQLPPNTVLLDIGCGEGYGADFLSSAARETWGIDVAAEAINYAKQKYARPPRLDYKVFDGHRIPFGDNYFGGVVANQVIEHVCPPDKWIAEIKRVLKPGGLFLVGTVNKETRLKPGEAPFNRHHCLEYNQAELLSLLQAHFKAVKTWGIDAVPAIRRYEFDRIKKIRQGRLKRARGLSHTPSLKSFLKRNWEKACLPFQRSAWPRKFDLNSLSISEHPVNKSLDLIAKAINY